MWAGRRPGLRSCWAGCWATRVPADTWRTCAPIDWRVYPPMAEDCWLAYLWRLDGHATQFTFELRHWSKVSRRDVLVPLVKGPLWEPLTQTSVTGLSADWLMVSLSDIWKGQKHRYLHRIVNLIWTPLDKSKQINKNKEGTAMDSVSYEVNLNSCCNILWTCWVLFKR